MPLKTVLPQSNINTPPNTENTEGSQNTKPQIYNASGNIYNTTKQTIFFIKIKITT